MTPQYHCTLGTVRALQGRLPEAIACFDAALDLRPDLHEAHSNRGIVLGRQGRLDEAETCFRQAIALSPDYADAHHHLAMALLTRGDFAAGWAEYEWRWQTPQMRHAAPIFTQPQWRGEPLAGRTLLIHAEQGYGDTIQFCRYAALAAERGGCVILQVQPPLMRLLRTLPNVEVIAQGEAPPPFDMHCPMLSLPLAFGTTRASVPAAIPYLHADPARSVAFAQRVPGVSRKIGVAWAGSSAHLADHRRSIPPDRLRPLLALEGFHFVSLQKDATRTGLPLTDLTVELTDFADTAALVANLDLVIAVDTAVAHLAAALGKPVWLLDRFDSCWRWLVGRSDTPWYPTMRLYRQPVPGDWDTVLAAVIHDLGSGPRSPAGTAPIGPPSSHPS